MLPDLSRPRLMAILNATPDSFSDGGLLFKGGQINVDLVARYVNALVKDGADIIDVGGESTASKAMGVWGVESEGSKYRSSALDRIVRACCKWLRRVSATAHMREARESPTRHE